MLTPLHEFYHALGAGHQHNRPDRDDYITVIFNNIDSQGQDQFDILDPADVHGTDYSYRSSMHYGRDVSISLQ